MRSVIRTIVVLTALNLAMASFGLAMEAAPEQPRPAAVETPPPVREQAMPVEPPTPPVLPEPTPVARARPRTPSSYRGRVVTPWPMAGQTTRPRILVIPAAEIEEKELAAIWEDMYVMAHIFDKKAKEPRLIRGVFVDFGEFFGRDSRSTEAIYLQGFGALFFMEVDLPISAAPKPEQEKAEKTEEDDDPTWQQARDEVFLSQARTTGSELGLEPEYGPEKVEQLKTELIKALKHAANIRNLKPNEWIILTVVGDAEQPSVAARQRLREELDRRLAQSDMEGYAAVGGYGGYGGSYGAVAGYGYGMGGFGATSFPSATVLTIRAKKAHVDAFAKGQMDFDEFQQNVVVLTYPHLSGLAADEQRLENVRRARPARISVTPPR
ncbi:MAG: hypothetical protein AMJ75_03215 [Phycisphaerae bacterium SM1_79]|nr:MAG: hypothetical protein AMJ75_03215 [Phycisphaerae bacterium SM1_79]